MDASYKKYITWIVIASIIMYLSLEFLIPSNSYTDNISYTISIVTFLSWIYVKWLWKKNPLEKVPKLHKLYRGKIVSEYDGIERDVEIKIKQSLFKLQISLKTDESQSKTFMSKLYDSYGETMLSYAYLNTPDAIVRNKSQIHYGMCSLNVQDTRNLTGQYFTDRKTIGDIRLSAVINKDKEINHIKRQTISN